MRYAAALTSSIVSLFSSLAVAGSVTFHEDNDWFNPSGHDYDYTQGMLISYNMGAPASDGTWQGAFGLVGDYLPLFRNRTANRQVEWLVLGQNIYTPPNNKSFTLNPGDRNYAGWLYTGGALMEDHQGKSLDYAELLVGVVGPASLARQTQNIFHNMVGTSKRLGWDNQPDNEPGLALSFEKKWRFHEPLGFYGFGVEAIPQGGITVGNVWTYAQSGVLFRFGQNLLANYGAERIRPALSGTSYLNQDAMNGWGAWNIYAGFEGRAVARDIFLDGNTFSDSHDVDKKPLMGTATAGFSFMLEEGPTLDAALIWCSKQVDTSRSCSHYGGVNVGWNF